MKARVANDYESAGTLHQYQIVELTETTPLSYERIFVPFGSTFIQKAIRPAYITGGTARTKTFLTKEE